LTWDQLSFEQVWLCFFLFCLLSVGVGFVFFMLLIGFCYADRYEISMTFIIGSDLSSVQITLNHKHGEFSVLLKILSFEQVSSSQQVLNLDSIHIRSKWVVNLRQQQPLEGFFLRVSLAPMIDAHFLLQILPLR
jgi:hypothetical protein